MLRAQPLSTGSDGRLNASKIGRQTLCRASDDALRMDITDTRLQVALADLARDECPKELRELRPDEFARALSFKWMVNPHRLKLTSTLRSTAPLQRRGDRLGSPTRRRMAMSALRSRSYEQAVVCKIILFGKRDQTLCALGCPEIVFAVAPSLRTFTATTHIANPSASDAAITTTDAPAVDTAATVPMLRCVCSRVQRMPRIAAHSGVH